MCISWRSVALHFAKLCLPKPLPLLLGTGRTPRPQTRLRVPTQSAHLSEYPHRRPTTLMCCPPKDLRSHGREKLGREARKSSCRTKRTRRMRRLPRNIGGPTRMACGCKHFDLVVRFRSFSCKLRAFPILPPSYLFFVLQKRMGSPLMGPNRGMSIGMTALANDNATNFTRNEKKKEKKEDPWKKEEKRKKKDPWKKPNPNQTTHTRNGKRRLGLSAWLTLLVLQVQVQLQLRRARQSTPRNHEPRRNVVCTATHHCTMATCYMVPFLHRQPLFTATMEQREKDWEGRRRSPEPRAEGAPKTPSERGIPVWRHLFACPFCVHCAFFLVCPFFLPHIVHLLVGLFREKGCGGAHSEDEGAPRSQGP